MPSFDVVSEVDMQEVDNAINQAQKEVSTRYDLKGTGSSVSLKDETITLTAGDKMKLGAIVEIMKQKLSKRGVGLKSLELSEPEQGSAGKLKQSIQVKQGIKQEDAKKIVKLIKDQKLKKIQAQIQQEKLRVTGPKRDDLQEVMALLKNKVALELQFVNFRD